MDDVVDLGVELLAHLEREEVPLPEVVDAIETHVTTNPRLVREILDAAELRGLLDREDGILRPRGGTYVSFESDVVTKEGEFTCQRCGTGISTGHFIRFDAGELGPFGSTCIRKVTGRE
ncbi:DUF5830 family protein [Haloarculaceae archaeon H-GB1-1]|nr:DUF5830 family protein [Haloarculaceae archaeon H-GB1-1]